MPFDKLFRKEAAEAAKQDDFLELMIREEIVATNEELEVFDSPAWARLDEMLAEELRRATTDIMSAPTPDDMLLARERARVVTRLKKKPDELRQKLDDLRRQLREVEGETDG